MDFNTNVKNKQDLNNLIDNIINKNKNSLLSLFIDLPINIYFGVEKMFDSINNYLLILKNKYSQNIISDIKNEITHINKIIEQHKTKSTDIKNVITHLKNYDKYLHIVDIYMNDKNDDKTTDEKEEDLYSIEDKEYNYDEENIYDDMGHINSFTTRSNLRSMEYKMVFDDDYLLDKKNLLLYKNQLIKELESVDKLNLLKQTIIKRKILISNVIEEYFIYLYDIANKNNIDNVFKLNGDIPYDVLKHLRYKVKASESENIKYTHDNGIIYYWLLKDAIVFMTI